MCKNAKIQHFWAKTHRVVLVPKSVTGTMMKWASGTGTTQTGTGTHYQKGTGTGTNQGGTGTTTSSCPVFVYFAPLSPVFMPRLLGTLRND